MCEMELGEACEILGVPEDADASAVKKAYHALSRKYHPDTGNGSNEWQTRLNIAYKVVMSRLASAGPTMGDSHQLAVREMSKMAHRDLPSAVQELHIALLADRSAGQARQEAVDSVRSRMNAFNRLKLLGWSVGALSGLLTWFGYRLIPYASGSHASGQSPPIARVSEMAAIIAILGALLVQEFVKWLENGIGEHASRLADLQVCARELAKGLHYADRQSIQESDVHLNQPMQDVFPFTVYACRLTGYEQRKLLISKSIDHKLLVPNVPSSVTPETTMQYQVRFKPSLYKPEPAPEQKKRSPAEEAKETLTCSIVMLILFSVPTVFLLLAGKTSWAWVTGILAAFAALGIVALASELAKAKKQERISKDDPG